jgi:oligopeptide/dipeptide ABC transporter ATP-binding protein
MENRILDIKRLTVHFETTEGTVHAVDEVSFFISKGEIVGLVGESGSGKTVTSLSIVRLIASPPGYYRSGEILFEGKDCLRVDREEIRRIRGGKIAYIFQDPASALNPVKRVVNQIAEAIKLHQGLDHGQSVRKTIEMMDRVGIPSAAIRAHEYPHQFSGGMRQRVMIAMALSCNPKLLIADEPTTALDVTIQAQILEIMRQLWHQSQMSILFITHDLGIIAQMCARVIVMYAGRVAEIAPVRELFSSPLHPYTGGLFKSRPVLGSRGSRLSVIRGIVPNLINPPQGCRFHPRCDHTMSICKEEVPPLTEISNERQVACHLIRK